MSYAEHGSRIFLTGKFNSNPLLRYGEYVVTKKRSEGRLKLFDSCSDLRAWSPNALENCRHFREIVEKRTPSGRIVPYDVLIENLIILGQTELALVRRQLEKYKSLRLTPEQEKQLRDIEYSTEDLIETSNSALLEGTRIVEDETGIPKRPGTPTQSICSSSSNFHDIEIDNDSSTDNNSEGSQEVFVSSETNEDTDRSNETSRREDGSVKRRGTFENDNNQGIIIRKDSEIIALNHELAAKNADLEEIKEICRNLESSLNEKACVLGTLRRNLKISQEHLLGMGEQMNEQTEEWKKKLYESQCLVDHLKGTLADKSQKCSVHTREIQDLREQTRETETLRRERDSLSTKLDEMKIVLRERNDLLKLNEQQAISLADQEDEIVRLLAFIKQEMEKYNDHEMRMKIELHDLRSELEAKNSAISQFETHRVTVRTDISPTGSLSQVQTSEIRRFKLALQEDLQAVEEELWRRRETRKNEHFQREELAPRSRSTRDRMNETAECEIPERDKDSMECTIEQLTMQVSATSAPDEEQDPIDEKILEDLANSKETIRRLVVELEPYLKERASLVGEITCLKEALEDAQRNSESRNLKIQKQYLSEVANSHGKECEEYTRRIAILENLLADSRKKYGKMEEKIRRESNEVDEVIDEVLAIHVKRSIEKITKLSAGLRGAGDEIDRKMAKARGEMETREAEIVKLREQVDFHASRGQGDEANKEHLKEIVRLKSEEKRLLEELRENRESLKATRDELQSYEFQLKASKKSNKFLGAQYKQKEREIVSRSREIERLTKENEGLNKTVLITDDLIKESDVMKIKLESLQDENSELINENTRMIKRCEDYENRLVDFTNREMGAREAFERAEFELRELAMRNESEIETLRGENEILARESETSKIKITKLTKEIQWFRRNNKDHDQIDNLWTEISKLKENKRRLEDNLTRLRCTFEQDHRNNDRLEENLKWQIGENAILQNAIKQLNENIERISSEKMPEEAAKKLLCTLPNKIYEQIANLREQLSTTESEGLTWQRELDEMRTKSLEDDAIIEKLRDDMERGKLKLVQRDKKIVALKEANSDLTEELKVLQTTNDSLEKKSQPNFENEIRKREMEILRLSRDIEVKDEESKNLSDRVQSLVTENNKLSNDLTNEKDLRLTNLTELQQTYNTQLKGIHDRHNDSINRMVAQQKEFLNNTGNTFDPETWLASLTMKEMAELHKRIRASNPCEMFGEASKTRALNDKQNQQLQQQDEKLHTDLLHIKNGHHKDSAIGIPYTYERRKFEGDRQKSVEASFNDNTFDMKRKNFFHQCAIKHKHDISH